MVAVSVTHFHRSTKSLVIALLVVLAGVAIAAPQATAGASKPFAFTPLTLTRANSSTVVCVVGSVKCSNVLCLRLLRTSDNGTHFETVSLPPIPANPVSSTGLLDELVFANANDGYALVGVVTRPKGTTRLPSSTPLLTGRERGTRRRSPTASGSWPSKQAPMRYTR